MIDRVRHPTPPETVLYFGGTEVATLLLYTSVSLQDDVKSVELYGQSIQLDMYGSFHTDYMQHDVTSACHVKQQSRNRKRDNVIQFCGSSQSQDLKTDFLQKED